MCVTIEDPVAICNHNSHSRCLLCGNLNPRSLNLHSQAVGDCVVKTRFKANS